MADTRPVQIKLVDLNDQVVDTMMFPRRQPGDDPRTFVWCGRRFREDDTGFYDELTAVEVADAQQPSPGVIDPAGGKLVGGDKGNT